MNIHIPTPTLIKISQLKPYEKNAKQHDATQIANVAESIRQFGFVQPFVVDENNSIVIGHCRLLAAKQLGIKKLPCIRVDYLTQAQIKALRVLDNKLNESAWDFDLLKDEIAEIDLSGFEVDFDLPDDILDENTAQEDEYDIPEQIEPRVHFGEVWQLGRHRLMCGDSTELASVQKLIGGGQVDLLFTDPPYNVSFNGRSGKFDVIKNDNLNDAEFEKFIDKTIESIKSLNCYTYYIWCNWKFYGILQNKLEFTNCIVWAKNVFGLGSGYRHQHEFCLFNGKIDASIKNESDLWEVAKDAKYQHPTQKPIALAARALKNHDSAKIIVDLFGGSGSTLIACEQLNRTCYMMELDEKYATVIVNRWEKFTGQKACRIE